MIKIMLVEDDKSLREIYGVRLLAEGYDIVSAGDGEEALAMAIKERPQLILSDVMMPKISGFDMLDILRSTTETKNIKVIMMTALSSEEQRIRGEKLGADRYLVKSQVGIEDVVHVVHEVLGDTQAAPETPAPQTTTPPVTPDPQPVQVPAPAPQTPPAPVTFAPAQPQFSVTTPQPPSNRNRTIQPLNDPRVSTININELLDKELAKEAGVDLNNRPTVATTEQEKAIVDSQLGQFSQNLTSTPLESIPVINVSNEGNLTQVPTPTPTPPAPQTTALPVTPAPQPVPAPVPAPQNTAVPIAPQPSAMPTPLTVPPRPTPPVVPPIPTAPPQPPQPPVAPTA